MRFVMSLLAVLVTACVARAEALTPTLALTVTRTAPALGVTLAPSRPVYLEIAYDSDRPIRLQAEGYSAQEPATKGESMNASLLHPAGSGRALVWIAYAGPARIDQVRVTAYDDGWKPIAALAVPADLLWDRGASTPTSVPPAWVDDLLAEERRLSEAADGASNGAGGGAGGEGLLAFLLPALVMLAVPLYWPLQAFALWRTRGRRRIATIVPAIPMLAATGFSLAAYAAGSNLWPITMILAAPFACAFLAAVLAFDRFVPAAR